MRPQLAETWEHSLGVMHTVSLRSSADNPQEELDQAFQSKCRHRVLGALSDTVIFEVPLPVIGMEERQHMGHQCTWCRVIG